MAFWGKQKKADNFLSILIGAVFCVCAIVYGFTLNHELGGFGGDNAQYIFLAQSICEGKGYRSVNMPGEPVNGQYPPMYPLLLAPIIYLFGKTFFLMHLEIIVFSLLSLFILKLILDNIFQNNKILIILILFFWGTSSYFILFQLRILSEIPYLFFSLCAIYFSARYFSYGSIWNRYLYFGSLFIAIASLTRTVGAAFFGGIIFLFFQTKPNFFQNIKKTGIFLLFSMTPFILWKLWLSLSVKGKGDYLNTFFLKDPYTPDLGEATISDFFLRFLNNFSYHFSNLKYFFINHDLWQKSVATILFYCFLILIIYGFIIIFLKFKNYRILCTYFIWYLLIILLWPFKEGERFLLPVMPLIFTFLFIGVYQINIWISQKTDQKILQAAPFLILLIILGANISSSLNTIKAVHTDYYHPTKNLVSPYIYNIRPPLNLTKYFGFVHLIKEKKNPDPGATVFYKYLVVLEILKRTTSKEVIISTRKPRIASLFSERKAVGYPYTRDTEKLLENLKKNRVDYVILDQFSRETFFYLLPAIQKHKEKFRVIANINGTYLLKFTGI
jgi:hypothetical protein